MKKFVCAIFAIIMITFCCQTIVASAYTEAKDFSSISNCTIDELRNMANNAETEEEINAVFEAMLEKVSVTPTSENLLASSNTTVTDSYIKFNSASVSFDHILTINVTILSNTPSTAYFNFKIGYDYPSSYRTDGDYISLSGMSKGTYTLSVQTKGFTSALSVKTDLIAREYKEQKVFTKVFDRPFDSKVEFNIIDQTCVTTKKLIIAFGSTVLTFMPMGNLSQFAQVVLKIGSVLSLVSQFDFATPDLAVGQCYKTTITFENFKCITVLEIYASKASYDIGESPIYTSRTETQFP